MTVYSEGKSLLASLPYPSLPPSTGASIIYGIPNMTLNNILVTLVKNHCDGEGQRQESPD